MSKHMIGGYRREKKKSLLKKKNKCVTKADKHIDRLGREEVDGGVVNSLLLEKLAFFPPFSLSLSLSLFLSLREGAGLPRHIFSVLQWRRSAADVAEKRIYTPCSSAKG